MTWDEYMKDEGWKEYPCLKHEKPYCPLCVPIEETARTGKESELHCFAYDFLHRQKQLITEGDLEGFVEIWGWLFDNVVAPSHERDGMELEAILEVRTEALRLARKLGKRRIRTEKFKKTFKSILSKFRRDDFCWRCGNVGWWEEQIDGPTNKQKVICPNPIHLGKAFEAKESAK